MSKLLNKRDLSELFGVTCRTIERWRLDGKIPEPYKKWGSPRWKAEEIDRAFAEATKIRTTRDD
jgi:predicted site-specific integrase-resolvase